MLFSEIKFPDAPLCPNLEADRSIKSFIALLLEYNSKVNLVSRNISPASLLQLFSETVILSENILPETARIVDAGSGNGILGLPSAILFPDKQVFLVESIGKKADFLRYAAQQLNLTNVNIVNGRLEDFFAAALQAKKKSPAKKNPLVSIISRGFPHLEVFYQLVARGAAGQAVIITSQNKIDSIKTPAGAVQRKILPLPQRDALRVLMLLKTTGEHGSKKRM